MDRDRARVLVLGAATVGLLVATLFLLDWFTLSLGGFGDALALDLRSIHGCVDDGCRSLSMSSLRGLFPTLCTVTFFAGIAFALLVAYQAFTRLTSGSASEQLAKLGYTAGILVFVLAGATAYLFAPELPTGPAELLGFSLQITRTWAPALTLLAAITGMFTVFSTVSHADVVEYQPILPIARKPIEVTKDDSAERSRKVTPPAMNRITPVESERVRKHSEPVPKLQVDKPSAPNSLIPAHARGKLSFAVLTAELTRAGIDARREDNSSVLVLWRDVVGVVARRLPAAYDGTAFVDIVSTAGSTLRILPWSRLTGDPLECSDPDPESDARPRALIARVVGFAPDAVVDPASRQFIDGTDRPAQLPDLETLAAHDARLA